MSDQVELLMNIVGTELRKAQAAHGPMVSAHEGYAVIKEELDELWEEVKTNPPDRRKMAVEAIQIAAMAARLCLDVLLPDGGQNQETNWTRFLWGMNGVEPGMDWFQTPTPPQEVDGGQSERQQVTRLDEDKKEKT